MPNHRSDPTDRDDKVLVTIGCYPRDDVYTRWAKDGLSRTGGGSITLLGEDGSTSATLGEVRLPLSWRDGKDTLRVEVPNGARLLVDLYADFNGQRYTRRVTFTVTGSEDDVFVSAIGPGAVEEKGSGLLAKKRYSGFESGVLIMGATTDQGTRVTGPGSLWPHGPGDGVGAD